MGTILENIQNEIDNNENVLTEIVELLNGMWTLHVDDTFERGVCFADIIIVRIRPDFVSYATFYKSMFTITSARSYNTALILSIKKCFTYYYTKQGTGYLNNL